MLPNNATCLLCGKSFRVKPSKLHSGRGKFCSRSCAAKSRTGSANPHWKGGPVVCTCRGCGQKFYKVAAVIPKGEGVYCSRTCKHEAQRKITGTASPSWKGGKSISTSGYVRLHAPNGNHVLEHRYVVEQDIGRPLQPEEHIHHINGDKTDNRLENLVILDPSIHNRLHPSPPIIGWSREHGACINCDTTSIRHWAKGLCQRCYSRQRRIK